MHRIAAALAVLLVFAARFPFLPPGGCRADDPAGPKTTRADTGPALVAKGDRVAREGRLREALDSWRLGYLRLFPAFRHQPFLYPVKADFLDRKGLRAKFEEEFRQEMPEEKARAMKEALAAFGLVPRDLDLRETLLGLYTEEVAGFYDPDTKRLYLIGTDQPPPRKWWEKALNLGYNADEEKIALVHEMSHALMDQYHDLLTLGRSAESDDDMGLAVTCLVEGEATLSVMVEGMGGGGDDSMLDSPALGATVGLMKGLVGLGGGQRFGEAPRIIRESMVFPYVQGLSFCLSLAQRGGGWKPVDDAFSDPPLSTEQVLHPEKYGRDLPVAVSFPALGEALGPRWSEVYANVMGEMAIRIVLEEKLSQAESERAAAGWGGDFYRLYERTGGSGKEPPVLAWATVWDSAADAEEFRAAMEKLEEARFPGEEAAVSIPSLPAGAKVSAHKAKGVFSATIEAGDAVWVLQGVPDGSLAKVAAQAVSIERSPKRLVLKKARPAVEFRPEDRLPVKRL